MHSQALLLLLFGIGSLFSLWVYRGLLTTYAREGSSLPLSYSAADVIVASVLTLWFLISSVEGFQRHSETTLDLIIVGTAIYGAAILLLLGFQCYRDINPIRLYGLQIFKPLQAFGWLLALLPLINFLQIASGYFFNKTALPQSIVTFIASHHDPKTLLILGLSVIVVAPVTEELIFRGFLYGVFSRYLGKWAGLMVTALLFAAIHTHLPAFLALFTLSLCLTLAYERSKSLWTPILMHSGVNTLGFFMLLYFPDMAQ
ncbi:MAG: type II CAAX endopeptidase family protein [Chthoniobacterales bacterium]